MSDWSVCVDAGGSGCRVALFFGDDTHHAIEVSGPPSSLAAGAVSAASTIDGLITHAKESMILGDICLKSACIGIAGTEIASEYRTFVQSISNTVPVIVVSDIYAHLIGAFMGRPGGCICIGTGVGARWMSGDQKVHQGGGWGFPHGDVGGGAWIGQAFIRHLLSVFDRHDYELDYWPDSVPTDRGRLVDWLRSANAAKFATYAPVVFDLASEGNDVANRILCRAANEINDLAKGMFPPDLPVCLSGGIGCRFLDESLTHYVRPFQSAIYGLRNIQLGRAPVEQLDE